MKKQLLIILWVLISFPALSQVTVNVQLPPAGMVQKDQLWNLVVMNNSNSTIDAMVSLDIQDAVTGQTVLSAVGRNFLIGKGVKLLSIRDVQPVQYNFLATELSGTFIPLGNYVACYRVSKNDIKGPVPIADECLRLNIAPMSPPLLNLPADRSALETPIPQFSWMPPTPSDMFSNLNYDLVIAEIREGQTPAEAVLYNTPVYSVNNIKSSFTVYPSTFSKLKTGQQYAWQVTARNALSFSAQTEVWSFSIRQPDPLKTEIYTAGYVQLQDQNEQSGISLLKNNEELLVKYYSFDTDHETTVRFVSADGKLIKEVKQRISYGDNFLRLKLGNPFKSQEVYTIALPDRQHKIFTAKFSIQ